MKLKISLITLGLITSSAFAATGAEKLAKACESSKRALAKHPTCSQAVKDEGAQVSCLNGFDSINAINAVQKKCEVEAYAAQPKQAEKLATLKSKKLTDGEAQSIKEKLAALKAKKQN